MADQSKYLKIFQAEAEEHLQGLNRGLLDLEKNAEDKTLIHELMRNAHTLKGSSRMLGLTDIGEIAHKMEDLFRALEDDTQPVTADTIDVLLQGTDAIRDLVDGKDGVEIAAIVDKLLAILGDEGSAGGGGAPPPATGGTPGSSGGTPPAGGDSGAAATPAETASAAATDLDAFFADEPTPPPAPQPVQAAPATPSAAEPAAPPVAPAPAQPGAPEPADDPAPAETRRVQETVRVDTVKLDGLLNQAGELLINKVKLQGQHHQIKNMLSALTEGLQRPRGDASVEEQLQRVMTLIHDHRNALTAVYQGMDEDIIELDLFSQELHSQALALRVLPVSTIFDEFYRTVRDLSRDLNKKAELIVQGGDTEIDKQLLEELRPALIHIIRNAVDHGLESPEDRVAAGKPETGTITLSAYQKGGMVVIEIVDDGRGIDVDAVKRVAEERGLARAEELANMSDGEVFYLILQPGFTTSPIITDLSGRGVGMDVVKTNLEKLKGDIVIESERGHYTKLILTAPFTLSLMSALLVECAEDIYAIPMAYVEETVRMDLEAITTEGGKEVFNLRGEIIPLVRLDELLGIKALAADDLPSLLHGKLPVVVARFRNQRIGLIVDAYLRDQDIVVKSLGSHLRTVEFASGATILRQGEPAIILNIFDIFAAVEGWAGQSVKQRLEEQRAGEIEHHILVVDDSITTRTMEKSILEAAGYRVDVAVSAEEALEKLDVNVYDLMVSDVEMPGLNGFELTEKIRGDDRFKELPVIIVTSLATDEHKRRGVEVGAQAYIVKGTFDQNVLLDTIRRLI